MTKSKTATISPEQASAILKVEQDQRLKMFQDAYLALCKKYKCGIVARPGLTADGRIGTSMVVVPSNEEAA